jgi:hypothetical protein
MFYFRKMKNMGTLLLISLILGCSACKDKKTTQPETEEALVSCQLDLDSANAIDREEGHFKAFKTASAVKIDGCSIDAIWSDLDWYGMNYVWMGEAPDANDYRGKFKLAWDSDHLYILVSVVDEHLQPTLADGKEHYWKGDYVEVFIDEDQSGGNHQYNHQAFAYHVSTEGHAIDKSTFEKTIFLDDHVQVQRTQQGNHYLWEMAVKLYDKDFDENSENNIPVIITAGKRIGFSIAYGDNDGKQSRENFMGSRMTHGVNNDEGYVNSDVFGSITFAK